MAKRPHAPEFGNWESQENVAYTVSCDKARENRPGSTMKVNPNDLRENPELLLDQGSPSRPKPEQEGHINDRRRQQEEIKIEEEEDSGFRQIPVSPAQGEYHKSAGGETRNQRYGSGHAENPMETKKQPVLLHDRNLGQEGHKGSYHSSSHGSTGGRTEPIRIVRRDAVIPRSGVGMAMAGAGGMGYVTPTRSVDGASSPNSPKGVAIPEFGDNNSSKAADRSTQLFNKTRSVYVTPTPRDDLVSPALGENHKRAGGETRNPSNTRIKGDAATVPKFGGWDENSPEAADGFTVVSLQARSGYVTPTRLDDGASSPNSPKLPNNASPQSCCFPWSQKRELKKLDTVIPHREKRNHFGQHHIRKKKETQAAREQEKSG